MPGGCFRISEPSTGWDGIQIFQMRMLGGVIFFNAPNFEADVKLKNASNINSSK